jgi:hypothetical protein
MIGLDLKLGEFEVLVKKVDNGRSVWEKNLTLVLKGKCSEDFLMFAKVFEGYSYYRPWVELFSINPEPLGLRFFGSEIEREIYRRIYEFLPKLGRIFVEYYEDRETLYALRRGEEAERSRMGRVLFEVGFRNLRNWYYPEGLREGGQKISGEKL